MGHSVLHKDDLCPKQLVSKTIQGNKLYQPPMPPPPTHTLFFSSKMMALGPNTVRNLELQKFYQRSQHSKSLNILSQFIFPCFCLRAKHNASIYF